MKKLFAVPTVDGKLCQHFGHCEKFAIVEIQDGKVVGEEFITPPVHQPGVYPKFLADHGVKVIISGGMGQRAVSLFDQVGISVIVGAPSLEPEELVKNYLEDKLVTGGNVCDH